MSIITDIDEASPSEDEEAALRVLHAPETLDKVPEGLFFLPIFKLTLMRLRLQKMKTLMPIIEKTKMDKKVKTLMCIMEKKVKVHF